MTRFTFERPLWFDADKVFDCGQCFRFEKDGIIWQGLTGGVFLKISQNEDSVFCETENTSAETEKKVSEFLGLNTDYGAINSDISERLKDYPFMAEAMKKARGVVLLHQEPWETLISFIVSQNNNIPRIKKIISELCRRCGEKTPFGYRFPTAESLLDFGLNGLKEIRVGYRDSFIIDAAEKMSRGELDFSSMSALDSRALVGKLSEIKGIGPKVASCIALFGFKKYDVFPVDTWIRKALNEYFGGIIPEQFGPYAGIAQQYIFYSQTH